MWKWNVNRKLKLGKYFLALCLCFSGCTNQPASGPYKIVVIQPTPGHCNYTIAPAQFDTLENLNEMRGKVGRVLYTPENLDKRSQILDNADGLKPIDADFIQSKDTYTPIDHASLFAASLYYAVETGYKIVKQMDPSLDLMTLVPQLNDTRIIYEARRSTGTKGAKTEVQDNAEYYPHNVFEGGMLRTIDYFFSYPTNEVKDIPLGLNLGIMNHEYSHLVFQHLFYAPGTLRKVQISGNKPTEHTLSALDEGMADYLGFMASRDPGYFLCTFPSENRDLGVPKAFTDDMISRIATEPDSQFDPHEGGAVWAAMQFQIGNAIGSHETNAKSLLKLMGNLLDCTHTTNGNNNLNFNFGDVAKCHQALLGGDTRSQEAVRQIYKQYMGSYGGGL